MESEPLWLVGAGGHAKVAAAAARAAGARIIGVFDDNDAVRGEITVGAPVSSPIPLDPPNGPAHVAVGANGARAKIVEARRGWKWASIRHPTAWVDSGAHVSPGALICAGVTIQPGVSIGGHCIINTGAIVEHDCRIGEFCHVAPGAALAGDVTLGDGAFVGIGACVAPGIRIGAWATVGAGAVVIRDVAAGSTVAGNPARPLAKSPPPMA